MALEREKSGFSDTLGGGTAGSKVEAAGGTWTLSGTDYGVPSDYSSGTYKYSYKYGGLTSDDYVQMITSGGDTKTYYKGEYIAAVADYYQECKQPGSSYKAGDTVSLSLRLYTKNSGTIHYNGKCWVNLDKHYDGFNGIGTPYYSDFRNSDGNSVLKPNNGYTYAVGDDSISDTFTAKMPENAKDGDKLDIVFYPLSGVSGAAFYYKWIYTYSESGSSSTNEDEDATTIGEDSDDEDDLVVGQVKNVKLTNKKVKRIYISFDKLSDATGYEIRYSTNKSFSGAKKLTTTSTKGYFKNSKGKKATFKKGKTYYVQVRAFAKDSDGSKVYGSWSAKKKVKIKK